MNNLQDHKEVKAITLSSSLYLQSNDFIIVALLQDKRIIISGEGAAIFVFSRN